MGLLDRLLRKSVDDHAEVRPLWHAIVALARTPRWYSELGLADTVPGRFDAVALVMALVLLRMEREPELASKSILLTELFVTDMDAQLRETGLGDMVVGKHVSKLMGALGGRMDAMRGALAGTEPMEPMLERNMTLSEGANAAGLAAEMRALADLLDTCDAAGLLAGKIAP
ncbi:MAG: ubiquinol-cytochrome C chaperone family protein [Pseudomonadota bacterium]|nr:ubiquinol-cytochrome C chaperone family protein [Pseudomonadota bacterium]